MLFTEAIMKARLGAHPEFLARLYEFIAAYRLESRPALIVQARACIPAAIDLRSPDVQLSLQRGAGDKNNWWRGFNSSFAIAPTFHGIGAISNREQPEWATEAHWDGHFIASTWGLPTIKNGDVEVSAIADFHSDIFGDFFEIVKALTPGQVTYEFTATLWQASSLHYLPPAPFGRQHVIRGEPIALEAHSGPSALRRLPPTITRWRPNPWGQHCGPPIGKLAPFRRQKHEALQALRH